MMNKRELLAKRLAYYAIFLLAEALGRVAETGQVDSQTTQMFHKAAGIASRLTALGYRYDSTKKVMYRIGVDSCNK